MSTDMDDWGNWGFFSTACSLLLMETFCVVVKVKYVVLLILLSVRNQINNTLPIDERLSYMYQPLLC